MSPETEPKPRLYAVPFPQETDEYPRDAREAQKEQLLPNNINALAIAIQNREGYTVDEAWWEENITKVVGNDASESAMLEAFMAAYDRDYPKGEDGQHRSRLEAVKAAHGEDEVQTNQGVPVQNSESDDQAPPMAA